MVSGRPEIEEACRQCGKLWSIYAYLDRKKAICPSCLADNEPRQLSLLTKSQEEKLKPVIPIKPNDYHYLVHCAQCRRELNPLREPWYAATCAKCWPDQIADYYYEQWRKYNP